MRSAFRVYEERERVYNRWQSSERRVRPKVVREVPRIVGVKKYSFCLCLLVALEL
jgi:hypothetical protein